MYKIMNPYTVISICIDFILKASTLTRFHNSLIRNSPSSVYRLENCLLDSYHKKSNMTTIKPVTHVIFDMDGLLLDTEKIYLRVLTEIARKYDKVYSLDVRMKVLGTMEADTAKIMVRELELPITPQEFTAMQVSSQNQLLGEATLMPGAERLVRHLHKHNVPIAVATSSGEDSVMIKTANHKPLFSLFHHMVMANTDPEVCKGKPNPDIFLVCASRFPDNPDPANCLVFEDAPNGVKAGHSAGMQVVMVPDESTSEDKRKEATVVIRSLLDFHPETFGLPPFEE